jgi:hypothetical protein
LNNELAWPPVLWAGIAAGLFLALRLTVGSGARYLWSGAFDRQMIEPKATTAQPPEMVLYQIAFSFEISSRADGGEHG